MQEGGQDPEVTLAETPRSASRLVVAAFHLYRRYPLLFLTLAGGVVVPFFLIVLVTTGAGPYSSSSARSAEVEFGLTLASWCLITPLISALHINAVAAVREGREPRLGAVASAGFRVLPAVVAVSIMSGLGIALGFAALIAPGIYLTLRWAVVAQAAAIEREGWLPALRSSGRLVSGNYGHVFAFLFLVLLVVVLNVAIELGIEEIAGEVVTTLVGLALTVLTVSFGALATALLYFDLRTRSEAVPVPAEGSPAEGRSTDSAAHGDGERPNGWYVDPDNPRRMRYWSGESTGWQGSTKTPRKIKEEWEATGESEQ